MSAPIPVIRFALMIFIMAVTAAKIAKIKYRLSLITTLISLSISFAVLLTSVFLSNLFIRFAFGAINLMVALILSAILTGIILFSFFRIRRFRKGFSFLRSEESGIIGVALSGVILFVLVLINQGLSEEIGWWLFGGVILCIIGHVIWYRLSLSKLYRKRVKERNTQEYERIISKKDELIQKLQTDNDTMSKILHRDNKLLPALHDAVTLIMANTENTQPEAELVFERINLFMQERTNLINPIINSTSIQLNSGNHLVDSIINHMAAKASQEGITLKADIKCDASILNEVGIVALDFETLLADLIDNAIHATQNSECKYIDVSFAKIDGIYTLAVRDSGILFEADTLANLGHKPITTRMHEGGSGVGFMTIFGILRTCGASITIKEHVPKACKFTKTISIRFDNNNSFIFNANHP